MLNITLFPPKYICRVLYCMSVRFSAWKQICCFICHINSKKRTLFPGCSVICIHPEVTGWLCRQSNNFLSLCTQLIMTAGLMWIKNCIWVQRNRSRLDPRSLCLSLSNLQQLQTGSHKVPRHLVMPSFVST